MSSDDDFVPDEDFIRDPFNDGYQLFVGNDEIEVAGDSDPNVIVMTAKSNRMLVFPVESELKKKILHDLIQGGGVPRGSYVSGAYVTREPSGSPHKYRCVVKITMPASIDDRTLNPFEALGDDLLGKVTNYLSQQDGSAFAQTTRRNRDAWLAANKDRFKSWEVHFHNVLEFQTMLSALDRDHNAVNMPSVVNMLCTLLSAPEASHVVTERGNASVALDVDGQAQNVRQRTQLPPFFITSASHIITAVLADPGMLDRVVNALCTNLTTIVGPDLSWSDGDMITAARAVAEDQGLQNEKILLGDKEYIIGEDGNARLVSIVPPRIIQRVRCKLFGSSLESPILDQGGPILVVGGSRRLLYFRYPQQSLGQWIQGWFSGLGDNIRPVFIKESDSEPWRLNTESYDMRPGLEYRDQVAFLYMIITMLSIDMTASRRGLGHGNLRGGFI